MSHIITAIAFLTVSLASNAEPDADKAATAPLPVMTWYHPVLTPGVSDMVLVCSVSAVGAAVQRYESDYWPVTLRIEERIYVAERYHKRLDKIRFITTGDFRKRSVGERLILFAGGEPYDGDDFLSPCWSGTNSDLGIVLHPKNHDDADKDVELLKQLRSAATGKGNEIDLFEAFAEFCPKGVAHELISRLRRNEREREASPEVNENKK